MKQKNNLIKRVVEKVVEETTNTSKTDKNTFIGKNQVKDVKRDYDFKSLNPQTKQKVISRLEDGGDITLENELFNGHEPEGGMIKSQLISIVRNARDLYNMVDKTSNLEGWVQAKITKAEDYLQAANNHVFGQIAINTESPVVQESKKKKD